MKPFLCIFLTILVIVCMYQLYKVLEDFFNGDKWTNTVKPISVQALEFPTVAFCNFNRVNKSKLVEFGIDEVTMTRYVTRLGMTSLSKKLLKILDEMTLVDHLIATLYETFWNSYAISTKIIGKLHPMLGNMTLGRALYREYLKDHAEFKTQADVLSAISIDCNAGYLCAFEGMFFSCCLGSTKFYNSYGSCFTIKPPNSPFKNRPYQSAPGIRSGLQIYMTTSPENYLSTLVNNWIQEGYSMFVGYDIYNFGMTTVPLPVGFNSQVQLKRVVETTASSGGVKIFKEQCTRLERTDLLNANVYKTCGCAPLEFSGANSSLKTCNPDDIHDCVNPKIKFVWQDLAPSESSELYDAVHECRNLCMSSCSRVDIEATSSLAVAPSPQIVSRFVSLVKKTGHNLSEEYFRKGFILLDVYFNDLSFIQIANYPRVTLEQLLGNIGGVLGLWIGASIFTLIQLGDTCLDEYRQRRKTKSNSGMNSKCKSPAPAILYAEEITSHQ